MVDNISTLRSWGVHIVEPESGRLAGGDVGAGRLADPAAIVAAVERVLGPGDLDGLRVVVSAGGTREPIDAVRVIANRSSGKQGYALAEEAQSRGAEVTLVSTVNLPTPAGVSLVPVETAAEMDAAITAAAATADIVVMAAAVADFRPASAADGKLKKRDGVPEVVLEPTVDILAGLGERKAAGQMLVGFAAETQDVAENARRKLEAKHLDLIVANDVSAEGTGFQHDTNAVTIFSADRAPIAVPLADKRTIARAVFDQIVTRRTEGP